MHAWRLNLQDAIDLVYTCELQLWIMDYGLQTILKKIKFQSISIPVG